MSDISSNNKRIEYIDAMRGFTMILVVYFHLSKKTFDFDQTTLMNQLLLSFRMPLFFFVSGFIGYSANIVWNWQTWWTMSRKKIMVQLLPTLFFGLIFTYAHCNLDFLAFVNDNIKLGYWFTIVLLEMFLLIYTMNVVLYNRELSIFRKRIFIALSIMSIMSFCAYFIPFILSSLDYFFNLFSFYFFFKNFPYFALGYICSMYKDSFSRILEHKYFITAIIVTFVLLFSLDFFYLMPYANKDIESITLLHIIIGKIISFLGLLIVYNTFRVYESSFASEKKIGKALQYVGKRTLDIYLLHYFFLPYFPQIRQILSEGNNSVVEIVIGVGLSLIVICFCLIVSSILRTSPILAKYLFGAKPTTNR